jgi:cell wall-associated NlpC family hydrolase
VASVRARSRLLVATTVVVAVALGLPPSPGFAAKRPSIAEVQRRVDALNEKADIAVEAYAQARISLEAARRRSAVAEARVHRESSRLSAVQRSMSTVAASAYRNGGSDPMLSLVSTSTPQTFLDQASALDRIARSQADRLAAVATARHRLLVVQADADRTLREQKQEEAALASDRAAIEKTLSDQRALLSSLQAAERARLAKLQAQRAEAARREAALARASRLRVGLAGNENPASAGPVSGGAGAAVSEAYAQLGKPYEWAAAGPDRFDCSGLTMWAWARGGVSLPHSSQEQYAVTQRVAQSDVQPGDLVFFGSPIHHVGIYIGGGRMIVAPHTGEDVRIQDAFRSDYVGAGRP